MSLAAGVFFLVELEDCAAAGAFSIRYSTFSVTGGKKQSEERAAFFSIRVHVIVRRLHPRFLA